jgi:hypothetical protein
MFDLYFVPQSLSVAVAAAAGVFLSKVSTPLSQTIEEIPKASLYFLVAVAVLAVMISFLGCCGAAQESPCMLNTYAVIILLLLVAEIVCGAVIVVFRKDMNTVLKKGLQNAVKKYKADKAYSPLDDIQHSLKCCGVNNVTDWVDYVDVDSKHILPNSCCPANTPGCIEGGDGDKKPFERGCWSKLEEEFSYVSGVAAIVAISVAIIQFVAVVGTCLLARAFKREYEVV